MLRVGDRLGKYQILAPLGRGNFGRVYQARDDALGREVTLKIIPTTNADALRTLVEAQAQNLCKHDKCVHVTSADVMDVQGELSVLIEMEYISAGSLQAKLEAEFLSCAEAVGHISQILYALEFAHSKGVLHRDVKPANIMIGLPHTKLSDFGIAYDFRRPDAGYDLVYSPHASPQVAAGYPPQATDDVFSAGMTLFRLVNNCSDWEAVRNALPDWRASVRHGTMLTDIRFQDFVPKPLQRIIRRACHPDSAKRYQSCAQFRQALEKLRFLRHWVRDADGNWHAENESILLNGSQVEHRVKGRRKVANCKSFASHLQAIGFAENLVADSTLR